MFRSIGSTIGRARIGVAVALALVCTALLIVGAPTGTSAADVTVTIDKFAFMPASITVPVGTRVVWTNQETTAPHTATSDTGVWDSGRLTTGQSYGFTFTQPGTFTYHCTIHPNMHGTVIVSAAPAAQAQAVAPAPTTSLPAAAAPAATMAPMAATPTRAVATVPVATAMIPASLPRTGGGGMATRIVGDDGRTQLPWVVLTGILGLATVAGAGTRYFRHLRTEK